MNPLLMTVLLLAMVSGTAAPPAEPDRILPKAIIHDGVLNGLDTNTRPFAPVELRGVALEQEQTQGLALQLPYTALAPRLHQQLSSNGEPATLSQQLYPLAWDIRGGQFYGVFVSDLLYADRRGFGVLKIPLERLLSGPGVETAVEAVRTPFLRDNFVAALPFAIPLFGGQAPALPAYDLAVVDDEGTLEVYALQDGVLRGWRYRGGAWTGLGRVSVAWEHDFKLLHRRHDLYLVTAAGQVFQVEGREGNGLELKPLDPTREALDWVIQDTRHARLYGGMTDPQARVQVLALFEADPRQPAEAGLERALQSLVRLHGSDE